MTSAKILVVDDAPQVRRVMRASLTAQGYTVYEARTARRRSKACGARRRT